jgi:hypothetical protein
MARNEIIYQIKSDGNVLVSTQWKCIGDKSDIIHGAIFATNNLGMRAEDRIIIAMKAADIHNYEIKKL